MKNAEQVQANFSFEKRQLMARVEKLEDELEQASVEQKSAAGRNIDSGIQRSNTLDSIGEIRKSLLLEEPVEVDLDALADKQAQEMAKAEEEAKKAREIETIPEVAEPEN